MPQEGERCANCFYAVSEILSRRIGAGTEAPVDFRALTCRFWPPEPANNGQSRWRQIKADDWCGQWSADNINKFGHTSVTVPTPIVHVEAAAPLVVPAPLVNVAAPEQVVVPAPVVNVASPEQVVIPAPVVNVSAPQGEAATIAIGTVTTVPPGQEARVTNRGTPHAAILDFEIPRGEQGPPGNGPP